jgi:2-keto-4-pentenoate hydratase/2-oxohepta-3-ene-1,7-dioic acid hydratase in catechol pathway
MVRAQSHVDLIKLKHQVLSALAIDMTARNLQEEVKKKGLPWSAVKGFDTFTPIRYVS